MAENNRWLELLGFFLLFVAVFLLLALATFSHLDPPATAAESVNNWGGLLGAYLAFYFYAGLGWAAWLLVPILALGAMQFIRQQPANLTAGSVLGWVLLVASLTGGLSLAGTVDDLHGGVIGLYLTYYSRPLLGEAGSLLFYAFLFIVGASVQTASSIRATFTGAWNLTVGGLRLLVRGWNLFLSGLGLCFDWLGRLHGQAKENIVDLLPFDETPRLESGSTSSASSSQSSLDEPETAGAKKQTSGKEETPEQEKTTPDNSEPEKADVVSLTERKQSASTDVTEPERPEAANGSQAVEVESERPRVDEADMSDYRFPSLDLLTPGDVEEAIPDEKTQQEVARKLEATFEEFGFEAEVVGANPGPVLTMYEVEPGPGVSVNKFQSRADDIKLSLAVQSVRIVSPIPGKSAVGIEVPNPRRALVKLRDVIEASEFKNGSKTLPLAFGLDVFGSPLVVDLGELPHLLIAGATGSGKSVCINSLICSLLYKLNPDELKMILIDPKRVELKLYDDLPHLATEVIDDPDDANQALQWAVEEMERRYSALSEAGCRSLDSYNEAVSDEDKIPYLVIIVDELADLMLVNQKECEQSITRIAQKARAVGIHLILATQRPSTDVITGLIKANMPARVAFRVSSGTDSRVVIDQNGAETLLGDGDLLYLSAAAPHPQRAQGAFLSDDETKDIIRFVKEQLRPSYIDEEEIFGSETLGELDEDFDDEYYEDAKELVVKSGKASASMIQRRFRVGYNRAARMVDMMAEEGIVGPHRGSKARRVLVEPDEYFSDNEAEEAE